MALKENYKPMHAFNFQLILVTLQNLQFFSIFAGVCQ